MRTFGAGPRPDSTPIGARTSSSGTGRSRRSDRMPGSGRTPSTGRRRCTGTTGRSSCSRPSPPRAAAAAPRCCVPTGPRAPSSPGHRHPSRRVTGSASMAPCTSRTACRTWCSVTSGRTPGTARCVRCSSPPTCVGRSAIPVCCSRHPKPRGCGRSSTRRFRTGCAPTSPTGRFCIAPPRADS
jgi:hypothetical protein